jgi:hypothetical protein
MTFLERYKSGETTTVYSDICKLGEEGFSEKYFADIKAVITETMERAAHNLTIIYNELHHTNYNFKRKIQYSFEKPLSKPSDSTDELLIQLDKAVEPFGSVPISLKLFFKIVGSCNFAWDYGTNENILWECADPIQIAPLDALVEQVTNKYWLEEMKEINESFGVAYLELSADYLHKDNISGGEAYSIEITPKRSVDSKLLNEEHETTFINYLRIIFDNCGFGRTNDIESRIDFKMFCDKVRPQLKKI